MVHGTANRTEAKRKVSLSNETQEDIIVEHQHQRQLRVDVGNTSNIEDHGTSVPSAPRIRESI